ncbi:MAG: hypothetical protein JNK85_08865 [Verrucomicrobiales bacterium]|nr:hypothetical protein [Verrucomicrobiales bacterium]
MPTRRRRTEPPRVGESDSPSPAIRGFGGVRRWVDLPLSRHSTREWPRLLVSLAASIGLNAGIVSAAENRYLVDVPDYDWHFGCFGTATGNLMGYWDRHGFPNFYTGPTTGGIAPLHSFGSNSGIRSLWATRAGMDGRPSNQPGHVDDYYIDYESTRQDPYLTANRAPHSSDCLGDFIGLSQFRWTDLNGECAGNIDGYAFNFFDPSGVRRDNYQPTQADGTAIPDIQSGLREWTRFRGNEADTFSQLVEFNPDKTSPAGYTFEQLRAEIDAGYPVLLFMQGYGEFSRALGGYPKVNPIIHAMLAYGYFIDDTGTPYVRYRTSWATGDFELSPWTAESWTPSGELDLPLRGVIGYRPRPRIVEFRRSSGGWILRWHGPSSVLHDEEAQTDTSTHWYTVERADRLEAAEWRTVAGPVSSLETTLPDCCDGPVFFRLRLSGPAPGTTP